MSRKRRNNQNRVSAPQPDAPTPRSPAGDLLSFVTPTEFVELPSKGLFYPEEHPLCGETVVEIKHMTAKEEDILTSEALLKNEMAIDRLLESVINNKDKKLDELLMGDKNAILIATRITGFGPFYEVTTTCPACSVASPHTLNLEDLGAATTSIPKEVTDEGAGVFSFELPKSQVRVHVRLLCSRDEKILTKTLTRKASNPITGMLNLIVVQANGVTDREQLQEFVQRIPLPDVKHLRDTYELIKPDIDLRFDFECPHCHEEGKVGMPMTAAFFWPNS